MTVRRPVVIVGNQLQLLPTADTVPRLLTAVYTWSQGANQAINTWALANPGTYGTGLAAETLASHIMLKAGVLNYFTACSPDLALSANTVTFALRVNAVQQATVTVNSGTKGNQNTGLAVAVNALDRVTIRQTTSNPSGVAFHLSVLWQET